MNTSWPWISTLSIASLGRTSWKNSEPYLIVTSLIEKQLKNPSRSCLNRIGGFSVQATSNNTDSLLAYEMWYGYEIFKDHQKTECSFTIIAYSQIEIDTFRNFRIWKMYGSAFTIITTATLLSLVLL